MKTAISIPDKIFRNADRAAKRKGISRSELFTKAVEKYLHDEDKAHLTERMNEMCRKVDTSLEPDIINAQLKILRREKW